MLSKHPQNPKKSRILPKNFNKLSTNKFSREYLLTHLEDPYEIVVTAAQKGDQLVLDFLLEPSPMSKEEIVVRTNYNNYKKQYDALQRSIIVREAQIIVILQHFNELGEMVLLQDYPPSISDYLGEHYDFFLEIQTRLLRKDDSSDISNDNNEDNAENNNKNDLSDININDLVFLLDHLVPFCKHYGIFNRVNSNIILTNKLTSILDDLLIYFREEHQQILVQQSEVFLSGKMIDLTNPLRARLHKEFSLELSTEFRGLSLPMNSLNFTEGLSTLDNLASDKLAATKALGELIKLQKTMIASFEKITSNKQRLLANQLQKKSLLLQKIFDASFSAFDFEKMTLVSNKLSDKNIRTTYRDRITGDNLIHIAAKEGKFETVLFLINRGVDYSAKNRRNIPAIDVSSRTGNTLLHHLTQKGEFDLAWKFLQGKANPKLLNNMNLNILDIIFEGKTLIHFFLEKLKFKNSDAEEQIVINLVTAYPRFSVLLWKNSLQRTAYDTILELPETIATRILDAFYNASIKLTFGSGFQQMINIALCTHFRNLRKLNPNLLVRCIDKISGTNNRATVHLTFLHTLQKHLLEAVNKKCDADLYTHLNEARLFINVMPKKLSDNYIVPLEIVFALRQVTQRRLLKNQEEKYFIENGKPLNSASSYLKIANNMNVSLTDKPNQHVTSKRTEQGAVYSAPLRHSRGRKNLNLIITEAQNKCPDPLHWFDQIAPKK
ncbi:MAG: ankyrin repeat domain-containing protein [Gammaproteobacteria bacterium]|nr:ankyrin repeat domain-containing protein [Gammaproteobacteria bacterium]